MSTADSFVRAAVLVIAALLLVPLLMMLFVLPFMGFGHMGGAANGMGVWPWLSWTIALIVLVGGGYLLYGALSGSGNDAAVEELRSAYARGEINDKELEKR
jgi:putative membrane protein